MDAYEATRIVLSRIQNLDPENASKIMGLLLIQDHGEKEMIRLAFGPEALLHSVILKARRELGLPSNSPPTPSTPSSPSPFISTNPISIARQNSSTSSRLSLSIPNPSSAPASWAADLQTPDDMISPMNSSYLPFYGPNHDIMDELQLQEQLSFLNDGSYDGGWGGSVHRRSCSVSDVCLSSDNLESGFGWKPCLYYARGYCKNGASCRFLHGAGLGEPDGAVVGSPSKIEIMEHELLRSKSAQQHRLAAASQLMASSFPYSPKSMNLLLQQQNDTQRAAAAALMAGEDLHKFGRSRSDFPSNCGLGLVNPASRQIYLTFPADSTFREEDVSNYFSIYGPVQDVRIPYQQKRMFGFVTFVYPETVKLILAKGNPHFVCDARVLVKPYKEKGKVPDKYRKQQMERGDFSPCATPTGLDSRDLYDLQSPGGGASMFYNNAQDMLWRRKMEEQADFQQALDLQNRRFMGLQLLDVKKHHHHRALSTGSPVPSPTHSPTLFKPNQLVLPSSFHGNPEVIQENPGSGSSDPSSPQTGISNVGVKLCNGNEVNGNGKQSPVREDSNFQESAEHNLPDSPFASPTKASGDYYSSAFSVGAEEAEKDTTNTNSAALLPPSSLDMASFTAFNCQIPRFSSGGIGMFARTGGPRFPVGS